MALNNRGGVVDDVIVWRLGDDRYWVMPNGTNFDDILGRFTDDAPSEAVVRPLRDETALLAVQGPMRRIRRRDCARDDAWAFPDRRGPLPTRTGRSLREPATPGSEGLRSPFLPIAAHSS